MNVTQLSILTAVCDGQADDLRACIESIPVGAGSPFARTPGTHNGRWTVLRADRSPAAPLRAGGLPHPMLMFSAVIDPPPKEWLRTCVDTLGPLTSGIWSHCAGWPGDDRVVPWLLDHRVKPRLAFSTWDAPVDRITEALTLRRCIERFAVRMQRSPSDELRAGFEATFRT